MLVRTALLLRVTFQSIFPGEQLETVHIERQRAQAAYDLIDLYGSFIKGDTSKLDALRKEGRNGRRQVAVLLRRLNTVAREVDLPSADKVGQLLFFHSCPRAHLVDTRKYRQILREIREGDAWPIRSLLQEG